MAIVLDGILTSCLLNDRACRATERNTDSAGFDMLSFRSLFKELLSDLTGAMSCR